jgi:pimeloyl-ACP methyl ester carboxylesterase
MAQLKNDDHPAAGAGLGQSLSHAIAMGDGRTLSFADLGPRNGAPVFFCHSIPGSRLVPEHATDLLEEFGLRMIIPERPGFGLSDFQPGRTIRDVPRDFARLADALGIDRFRVLAASSGCPYALACCVELPERVERAVIMSGVTPQDYAGMLHSAVPAPLRFVVQNVRSASSLLHRLLMFGMSRDPERALASLRSQLSPEDQRVLTRPEPGQFIVRTSLESSHRGVRGMVYDAWLLNRRWDFSPSSIPPTVPVSFWWGENDVSTPVEHGRALAGEIPHAAFHTLGDCGHFGVIFDHLDAALVELSA